MRRGPLGPSVRRRVGAPGARLAARLGVVLVALGVVAGCRIDAEVEVTVNPDGTGVVLVTVTADPDVVDAVPDLADEFRATDLTATGWQVDGPAPTAEGGLAVELRHDFGTVAEANTVLDQISAPDGPLRELGIDVSGGDGDIEWTFAGQLDFSGGLQALADQDLVALAGGTPWLDELNERAIAPEDATSLTIRVSLPGTRVADDGTAAEPGAAEFRAVPGESAIAMSSRTRSTSVEVQDARDLRSRMLTYLAIYGGVVAVGVAAWWLLRQQRRARRRRRRAYGR